MTRETKIDLPAILTDLGPKFAQSAEWLDATDGFVSENYQLLRDRKVFSAQVPMSYGGGGASHGEIAEFIRGVARHCPSTALALAMHQHLVSAAVANDRAGRPGKALLEKVAAGELVLVSTGANDWLESNGTAKPVDGGYRISAIKPFASGSSAGDMMITSAVLDLPGEAPQVLHFPLSLKSEGVTLMGDWQTMGMRATGSQTIQLSEVFVPEAAISLRRSQAGFHPAFSVILTVAMPIIMSAYLGIAEAAAEIAQTRAKGRAGDAVTQILVGEMENLLTTARLARDDMVRLANDLDFAPTVELASAILTRKAIAARHVIATTEKALEVLGGSGFFRKAGIERLLRDAHAAQFHPLQEKRQQVFTGRHLLGLAPVETGQTKDDVPRAA
ncbi:acyl-CoA dehydrogenase family protein [Defluviimonas sp. D31]|uniref:acyl-CoA dehydrogenase family protein n=1 Tax=Defluviimonas sp. D31 TaxID=3083253 RepID=UPI00296F575A|nr:acyl-CoA dehydrogenase family protein [Defluviimonas sp. D31]MDW4551647.1 acyl-CoA dehydrogenase family protein [Defluviimonas sp. D31]